MNRRVIIFAIVAVTLVAGLFLMRYWQARSRAARLVRLTGIMNLSNAEARVQIGREILELDPLQDAVRLKLARAFRPWSDSMNGSSRTLSMHRSFGPTVTCPRRKESRRKCRPRLKTALPICSIPWR